jgi:hypothetical protein
MKVKEKKILLIEAKFFLCYMFLFLIHVLLSLLQDRKVLKFLHRSRLSVICGKYRQQKGECVVSEESLKVLLLLY